MADTPADPTAAKKNIENRISQQGTLLAFCTDGMDKTFYNTVKNYQKLILVDDSPGLTGSTVIPYDIKKQRDEEVGKVYYTLEDLNIFMNSLDPMALSMLQPYIKFIKTYKGKEYVLNIEDANRASLRAFISGKESGIGSIGSKREVPGGFGIEKFDMEYLVNKESGYLFDLYKIHLEMFFGSMEDIRANLSASNDVYSPLDVLIAFPSEVGKFQMSPGQVSEQEVSNAYKVTIEVGYNIDSFSSDGSVGQIRDAWYNILKRNNGIGFDKFADLMKKMRFRIEAQIYKWSPQVTENGNIKFQFDFFGYDRGIGSHPASNILMDNKLLDDFAKLEKTESEKVKDGMSKKEKADTEKKSGETIKSAQSNLKGIALRFPRTISTVMDNNWSFVIDGVGFGAAESGGLLDGLDAINDLLRFTAKTEHFRAPLVESLVLYDYKSIMKDGGNSSTLIVNTEGKVPSKVIPGRMVKGGLKDKIRIPYFYLGDLLNYFASMATTNLTAFFQFKDSSDKSFLPQGSYVEIITGNIEIVIPGLFGEKRKKVINISALPIAWDVFLAWWYDKISSRPNLVYKLEEFLQDFFGYFFNSMLQSKDEFHLSDIEIGSHVITKKLNPEIPNSAQIVSYYLYQNNLQDRKPMRFFIGNRRGMMKSCNFSVEDDQHLNSYMMASAVEGSVPDNNLQIQRAMYNVDMELFGNAILQPGMLIEVVPTIVGAPLGSVGSFASLYDLGIGGFYNVVSTKIELDQGTFKTSIHGKYYGKPAMSAEEHFKDMESHRQFYFSRTGTGQDETIFNAQLDPQSDAALLDKKSESSGDWGGGFNQSTSQ